MFLLPCPSCIKQNSLMTMALHQADGLSRSALVHRTVNSFVLSTEWAVLAIEIMPDSTS